MTLAIEAQDKPRASLWNDPRVRSWIVQGVLLTALLIFAYEIVVNTYTNLRSRNIASGLDFLSKTAGFGIDHSLIAYDSTSTYGRALLVGFLNTILVSALSIALATLIGFLMGVMRLSKNWLAAGIGTLYVEVFRNVPLLLWLYIIYSAILQPLPGPKQALGLLDSFFLSNRGLIVPKPIFYEGSWLLLVGLAAAIVAATAIRRWANARQAATGFTFPVFWTGLGLLVLLPLLALGLAGFPVSFDYPELKGFNFQGGLTVNPEFLALWLGLSVYTGTYIAESVRAGILAVSHGQTEAAHALGLPHGRALQLIIVPQAMRVIIPPLASTYLSLTKNSSLAIGIGYWDLVGTGGTVLNQTGQAIEVVAIWMIVYLSLSLLTSVFMNWFNARVRLVER